MQSQNFFGFDGLTDLSRRSGIDMRPTLLRVLTDLYVHRLSHSADEERHYTELALRMHRRCQQASPERGSGGSDAIYGRQGNDRGQARRLARIVGQG